MNIFSAGGILDRFLEGYQERKGQKDMAEMLSYGLHHEGAPRILLAEGAVGVGKSLAYLFSSLIRPDGTLNKETIVVSTSSITLQNQLEQKDLPFVQMVIQNHFGERINFVSLKGITNFCCLREFERYKNILKVDYPEIYELYADGTGTGEQPDEIDYELWQKITTNHSDCDGQTCKYIDQCYYERRKERARVADVIIINHALLATDWYLSKKYGASVLPPYDILIIDECHELEQSILNFLGGVLSITSLERLEAKQSSVFEKIAEMRFVDQDQIDAIQDAFMCSAVPAIQAVDWEGLKKLVETITEENTPGELITKYYYTKPWQVQVQNVIASMEEVLERADEKGVLFVTPVSRYKNQFEELAEKLEWLQELPNHVAIWVEGQDKNKVIKLTPVNVNEFLEAFWKAPSVTPPGFLGPRFVLTSATATVNGTFEYLKEQLGIPTEEGATLEGVFESPFNYAEQVTHFFIPEKFNPKNDDFDDQVLYGIKQILKHSPYEKTLILFTSYHQMNKLVPQIRLLYSRTHVVLEQNPSMSKEFILRKFQESERAILVAQAASFGTGVDIKGNKNIIITKLSFEVPTDPIFKTKERLVEEAGGNGFFDLNVPIAAIRARQQVGRGIRSIEDKAIIAIFDGRIVNSRWGRTILGSLPRMKLYRTI